jgi:hypothetical protein
VSSQFWTDNAPLRPRLMAFRSRTGDFTSDLRIAASRGVPGLEPARSLADGPVAALSAAVGSACAAEDAARLAGLLAQAEALYPRLRVF